MNYAIYHLAICLTCLGTVLAGCQTSEVPSIESAVAVATPVSNDTSADNPAPDVAASDALTNATSASPPAAKLAQFSPPFPERVDPFEPPKRAAGTVRRDEEHGEAVELKGFINVDQPRVVLSIDGVVSPIPEGGEKYGVQVISIQPPSVVLQRGRSRWTATLE